MASLSSKLHSGSALTILHHKPHGCQHRLGPNLQVSSLPRVAKQVLPSMQTSVYYSVSDHEQGTSQSMSMRVR